MPQINHLRREWRAVLVFVFLAAAWLLAFGAAGPAGAMGTHPNLQLRDVHGPYMLMCRNCQITDNGTVLKCTTCDHRLYGRRFSGQIWLPACLNGAIYPDVDTGKLRCTPSVVYTPSFKQHCDEGYVMGSTLYAQCREKKKKGFSFSGNFSVTDWLDLTRCKKGLEIGATKNGKMDCPGVGR